MLDVSAFITYILQKRTLTSRAAKKWISQDANFTFSNNKIISLGPTPYSFTFICPSIHPSNLSASQLNNIVKFILSAGNCHQRTHKSRIENW